MAFVYEIHCFFVCLFLGLMVLSLLGLFDIIIVIIDKVIIIVIDVTNFISILIFLLTATVPLISLSYL